MHRLLATAWLTTMGACALPPSPACERLVACEAEYDSSADLAPYREDGDCWHAPQTASLCTEQCRAALEALRAVPDVPEACRLKDDVTASAS